MRSWLYDRDRGEVVEGEGGMIVGREMGDLGVLGEAV